MAALAHIGVAFAAKRAAPDIPLWILLVCTLALDILCMLIDYFCKLIILLTKKKFKVPGTEWTHSLFTAFAWSVSAVFILILFKIDLSIALFLGLIIFLHWVVDYISWPMSAFGHPAPGLLLHPFGGSPVVGLGLYRSVLGMCIGEGTVILGLAAMILH
jgi:membrane-bound metal-dependent hydrolase YbcI (DUF457 family)